MEMARYDIYGVIVGYARLSLFHGIGGTAQLMSRNPN